VIMIRFYRDKIKYATAIIGRAAGTNEAAFDY